MGTIIKLSGIYVILNIINNKRYVGHSVNIKKRWKQHRTSLNRNVSIHTHLQAAWNKYGKPNFSFSVIESLPYTFTKEQFEEVETKWVLLFKSHLSEFGYNSVLPGSHPIKEDGGNTTKRKLNTYVCVNSLSGEILRLSNEEIEDRLKIPYNRITDLCSYWKGKGRKRSYHGWMIIREKNYNPEFDYIGYKKERIFNYKYGSKVNNTEYYRIRKKLNSNYGKRERDVIPYKDRKIKRVSVLAHNIETGEEKIYSMLKDTYKEFTKPLVIKCINNEYGKYKHRGYWFKRL